MSRKIRTPTTDAERALNSACEFWVYLAAEAMSENPCCDYVGFKTPREFFESTIFGEVWDNPETNGDKSVGELGRVIDEQGQVIDVDTDAPFFSTFAKIQIMNLAISFAVLAMKAEKDNKRDMAWTCASDASYWAGVLNVLREDGHKEIKQAFSISASEAGRAMAHGRHKETRQLKESVIEYWKLNIDKGLSAQDAANILVRFAPISHKKIAEYVAEERKKLGLT